MNKTSVAIPRFAAGLFHRRCLSTAGLLLLALQCAPGPAAGAGTLKDALRPAPLENGFAMPGYHLWCPSVIKVGGAYHLFASRWPARYGMAGWTEHSECVRATSQNLLGPYVFQEVVLQKRAGHWDNSRVHNGRVVRAGGKFVLYYINNAVTTGCAWADSIEGPWTRSKKPLMRASNAAILVRPDDSIYVFARLKDRDGANRAIAFRARTYDAPYELLGGGENLLPGGAELEDPAIWWAGNQYNVLLNDWKGRATGVSKAGAQYFSKDGIHYTLASREPVFTRQLPQAGGAVRKLSRRERPFVFVNEREEVVALFTACLPEKGEGDAFIAAQPVANYKPDTP